MKYARIENDKVLEIIDFNPEGCFTAEIVAQFVPCDELVEQNDMHENGVFSKLIIPEPEPVQKTELEILQENVQELNGKIKMIYEFALTNGFITQTQYDETIAIPV